MWRNYGITQEQMADAIKSATTAAVADANNATTLAGHMAQCERDKADMKAEQLRMHGENSQRFKDLESQNSKIMRVVWGAAGVVTTLHLILSTEGAQLFAKILH